MGNYTPGVPGGAAATKYNAEKKAGREQRLKLVKDKEAEIKAETIKLKTAENNAAIKQTAITTYKKAQTPKLAPEGSGTPNATQKQALDKLAAEKAVYTKQVSATKLKIAAVTKDLNVIKTELKEIYTKTTKRTSSFSRQSKDLQFNNTFSGNKAGFSDADKLIYQYNLPMLKSVYLNPFGPQGNSITDRNLLGAPINEFNNARLAWTGVTPSRGTIQMSRMYAENAPTPSAKAIAKGLVRNETPYGFRFLYNPTDVSMAWGIVDAFSPEYAQSGENGMSGVAVGLMKGTIAFTLLLNRIGDMNILQDDGSYASYFFKDDPEYNPNVYSQIIYPAVGTQTVPVIPTPVIPSDTNGNVWGGAAAPSLEERAQIAKRGTMYDIEYLFKAMGGYYAEYTSGLNGKTADKGWLQPIPMELHLGAGLRYLVRISSLDLKHMMFNERMVPTLTTVNVVCTRYYDSPDAFTLGDDAFSPAGGK
jgi:hypothetical protein